MLEKTVTLYLMDDGDLNGRIECTIGNWEGAIYKIPKPPSENNWCNRCNYTIKERITQPGIYFLFGKDPNSGQKTVYVGQSGDTNSGKGVWNRLNGQHTEDAKKEGATKGISIDKSWDEAVIVVHNKAASFLGGVGLNYLENKFYWVAYEANEAGDYKMLNGNEPNSASRSIRPGDKIEADDFAEHVKTVMRVLGYGDLFKASDDDVDKGNRNMFRMSYKGHKARMEKRVDGFWLQKGSWISKPPPESTEGPKKPGARYPKKLIRDYWNGDEYVDKNNGDNYILKKPIRFDRASTPATFVRGQPSNYSWWRNFEGEMVDDVEGKKLQDDE